MDKLKVATDLGKSIEMLEKFIEVYKKVGQLFRDDEKKVCKLQGCDIRIIEYSGDNSINRVATLYGLDHVLDASKIINISYLDDALAQLKEELKDMFK